MAHLSKLSRNKRTDTQKKRKAEQPDRTAKNRIRRLLKHLRIHNNDDTAKKALSQ